MAGTVAVVNVNGTVIWMVVGEEAQAVIAADSVATELTVALVVPVPPKGRLPPPPDGGTAKGVRTSVMLVIAEPLVTTVAIGISAETKAVVFTAGTQLDDVFR